MAKAKKSDPKGLMLTEEILRYRLMYIKEFESITPEAAKLLTASGGHKLGTFGDVDYDPESLEWIKALSDKAARELFSYASSGAGFMGEAWASSQSRLSYSDVNLSGLGSLSDFTAEILSKAEYGLTLSGLTELSDAAAAALSKFKGKGKLILDGLTSLSDKAAASLGEFAGRYELSLNGFTSLPDKIAAALGTSTDTGNTKGVLRLEGLTELSDRAAEGLASHNGELVLSGLTSISDAAAEALSKHEEAIYLYGLESISDAAALSLSMNSSIEFSDELSKHIAKVVKKHAKATSKMTSKDQTKIRGLIKTKDPDNVDFACNLLETLGASEGDWVKLFPKTRIYGLLETEDTKIWNTLAKAMRPHVRAYEELKAQVEKCSYSITPLVKAGNDDVINLLVNDRHPTRMIELCLENQAELSDEILELIANYNGESYEDGYRRSGGGRRSWTVTALTLNGLTELSEEIAASLVKVKGGLYLDGLTEISDGLAKVLSKHKLSPEERATEAQIIRNGYETCAGLSLNGLTELGDAAAASLAKVNGGLCLNGLTKLSDETARALSNHESEVGLSLNGLTKLSGEAAASLAKVGGGLRLNGLTKLSDEAAQGLSNYERNGDKDGNTVSDPYKDLGLCLDGLTTLSVEAAEALAKVKGNIGLSLNGLTKLSGEAATSLAKVGGSLRLNGLTKLSDETAKGLSKHEGGLCPDGWLSLPKFSEIWIRTDLELGGLTELKDDVAEALSKHEGALDLPPNSYPAVWKMNTCHVELGDAAASALAKKKGTINQRDPQEYVDSWKDV